MRTTFWSAFSFFSLASVYSLTVCYYFTGGAWFTFLLPLLLFVTTIGAVFYMQRKQHSQLTLQITCFFMTVSLMYSSANVADFDLFASILFHVSSMLSLSILVHFLYTYFALRTITWPYFHSIAFMYSFPVLLGLFSLLAILWPSLLAVTNWAMLLFFANGLLTILYILIRGYQSSRHVSLLYLMASCIAPFLPYVLLYAIPQVLLIPPLLDASIASLAFILLPISFLFTPISARLLDVDYYLSRLRYYSLYACGTALLLTVVLSIISALTKKEQFLLFAVTAVIIYAMLVLKERLDFTHRRLLFTAQHTIGQQLFQLIHHISRVQSKEVLYTVFAEQLQIMLRVDTITVIDAPHDTPYVFEQQTIVFDRTHQKAFVIHNEQKRRFSRDEMLLIELAAMYADAFIQNIETIEQLYAQIDTQAEQLPWLQRLLFQHTEQEKKQLAQELHDVTLQQLIATARQIEPIASEDVRTQLLDMIYELRAYCETLSPPLLTTMGLQPALHKLIKTIHLRANFHIELTCQLDDGTDEALLLPLYRIIQELLHNAEKHSDATTIHIHLRTNGATFTCHYEENVAANVEDWQHSMGLTGIYERAHAFQATVRLSGSPVVTMIITNEEADICVY